MREGAEGMRKTGGAEKVLKVIMEQGELTLSEIVERTGISRSWAWKLVKRLEKRGVVDIIKTRGIIKVKIKNIEPQRTGVMRIGILRAAEYPYMIYFRRKLSKYWNKVEIEVHDDAFTLASRLAQGKVHLAMIPVVTALLTYRLSLGRVRIIGGGSGGGARVIENPSTPNEVTVTTMASSMEYCATREGLPGPRLYARSGDEILRLVEAGRARFGVVWSPYTIVAERRGLRVRTCDLPACCVLTAHESLSPWYELVARIFAESVSDARRTLDSPSLAEAYAALIGLPRELVTLGIREYEFYEEPPLKTLEANIHFIREAALPAWTVRDAVYK